MTHNTQSLVKYVHQANGNVMVKITAGDVYVTGLAEEHLTTVLGSCVSVCLRCRNTGIGGANHFMLPGQSDSEPVNTRYGVTAINQLVEGVIVAGGNVQQLEAKVFGGGSVIRSNTDIGALNIACAFEELGQRDIPIAASDVGLRVPRKIIYDPKTGKVQLLRLRSAYHGLVAERERRSLDQVQAQQQSKVGQG